MREDGFGCVFCHPVFEPHTFNEHPGKVFRVRDLYEHLGLPTDEPSIDVTRSRLGRLVRQGLLEQPGRGRYQGRT
ncbi:type IV toxin-antitoxin system AbiEi family antitoxin domain-containing protein [Streptomyces sp. NPDC052052]|uniref:type IV toxin-antitoxin system AbiEi family antitoxin domain-containing protein n=1 Tax=Streptomyces sp. NPDC052052 TaxID=3154756 RepID=UPI003425D81E